MAPRWPQDGFKMAPRWPQVVVAVMENRLARVMVMVMLMVIATPIQVTRNKDCSHGTLENNSVDRGSALMAELQLTVSCPISQALMAELQLVVAVIEHRLAMVMVMVMVTSRSYCLLKK